MEAAMERFFELLEAAEHVTAFTGAGVSTLSGIPDFRGVNGVFKQSWHGYNVEEIHEIGLFRRRPEIFYGYAKNFLYPMADREPNIVHTTLAEMERRGILNVTYTQNIDMLHRKAGSRRIEELHGSPLRHHCLRCRREFGFDEIRVIVMRDEVPYCPDCGGVIKPDVVFFGEELDGDQLDRAFHDFEATDLLLVLGTSLTVPPAANLPMATQWSGGAIVIVNAQPTGLDDAASCRFSDLDGFFQALHAWLE